MEAGIDSLMAVEFQKLLSMRCGGAAFSPTVLFDYPTVFRLSQFICDRSEELLAGNNRASSLITVRHSIEDISVGVIGMACRFPGHSSCVESFWETLVEGKDCFGRIPKSRFDADAFYDPSPQPVAGKMYTLQRHVLEVSYSALFDSGWKLGSVQNPIDIGVFVGASGSDWSEVRPKATTSYSAVGDHRSILANRVSYALGLQGPSVSIDTASSAHLLLQAEYTSS
eukprot:UC1_evm1s806